MQIALNKNKQRIHIDESKKDIEYYCPVCEAKLIRKMGEINIHHFAHAHNQKCCDNWTHDMSEWHTNWQNRFPIESQEVVIKGNGAIHRADVKVEDIVIEFQHSPISTNEFNNRNQFYTSMGYKVIWVFDMQEKFTNKLIYQFSFQYGKLLKKFNWDRASKIFKDFEDDNIDVFFQETESENGNMKLWKIDNVNHDEKTFIAFGESVDLESFKNYIYKKDNNIDVQKEKVKVEKENERKRKFIEKQKENIKGRSIFELWDDNDIKKTMTIKNLHNGMLVNISCNPSIHWNKYGRVYGYAKFSNQKKFEFNSRIIRNAEFRVWELVSGY